MSEIDWALAPERRRMIARRPRRLTPEELAIIWPLPRDITHAFSFIPATWHIKRKCLLRHQMIIKQNRSNKTFFWGCSKYPSCQETFNIDQARFEKWVFKQYKRAGEIVKSGEITPGY